MAIEPSCSETSCDTISCDKHRPGNASRNARHRATIAPCLVRGTELVSDDFPVFHWRHDTGFQLACARHQQDTVLITSNVRERDLVRQQSIGECAAGNRLSGATQCFGLPDERDAEETPTTVTERNAGSHDKPLIADQRLNPRPIV